MNIKQKYEKKQNENEKIIGKNKKKENIYFYFNNRFCDDLM